MSRTLLDISDDLRALDDLLFEVGGDLSDPRVQQAVDGWFAELSKDLDGKVDNYAALIKEMEGRAALRAEEAHRLSNRARIDGESAKWLKNRLKGVLEERGVKKLETRRFRVSIAGNGGKQPMQVDPEVPSSFTRTILETDHDAIRGALEAGENLAFARLLPRGTHLSIK